MELQAGKFLLCQTNFCCLDWLGRRQICEWRRGRMRGRQHDWRAENVGRFCQDGGRETRDDGRHDKLCEPWDDQGLNSDSSLRFVGVRLHHIQNAYGESSLSRDSPADCVLENCEQRDWLADGSWRRCSWFNRENPASGPGEAVRSDGFWPWHKSNVLAPILQRNKYDIWFECDLKLGKITARQWNRRVASGTWGWRKVHETTLTTSGRGWMHHGWHYVEKEQVYDEIREEIFPVSWRQNRILQRERA